MKTIRQTINILILFLLFNEFSYSQENNYEAVYTINYTPINFDSIYNTTKSKTKSLEMQSMIKKSFDRLKSSIKQLHKIKFILKYNRRESIFYKEPLLSINEKEMASIYAILSINNSKYFTQKNQLIRSLNAYGQDFILEMPKIKWELTNTQKKIEKFNCFKATAKIERENSKGKFLQLIEAWFAPEIAFNYGPKEYNGLPGLIIKLKIGENVMYNLTGIRTTNYKKIEKPTIGEKISLKDFNALGKSMFENRKN